MKYLCLDTSTNFLVVALIEDDQLVDHVELNLPKQQSELLLPTIESIMKKNEWLAKDINGVVVTEGPGSYTGVRIAMTFAKVFCTQFKIELYTISTFLLYAGLENGSVILDARSKKVFIVEVDGGVLVNEPHVILLHDLDFSKKYIGNVSLIGQDEKIISFASNFLLLKKQWKRVENIHALTPVYCKGV